MRIIAGEFRGRTIDAPQGEGTRPTTDRVREAMMSSLASMRGDFEGAVVLDAFAGSGALGIEVLSRGAKYALFFESDRKAQKIIARNLAKLGIDASRGRLINDDVLTSRYVRAADPFDLVFFDPPYAMDAHAVLAFAQGLVTSAALDGEGLIVYEHALTASEEVRQAAHELGFEVLVSKKYGKTGVTMMQAGFSNGKGEEDEEGTDTGDV